MTKKNDQKFKNGQNWPKLAKTDLKNKILELMPPPGVTSEKNVKNAKKVKKVKKGQKK